MEFLQRSANHIFKQHPINELKDTCVVLPTRRAVFYFKQELAQFSEIPFIAPDVFAIDDFVMQLSGVRPIDSISLLFELFNVFKEIDEATEFDNFLSWGSTLLKDFDTIDQYLVENPKSLFDYMSDAKAITRWGRELEKIGKEVEITVKTEAYFSLFSNISTAYVNLQNRLIAKGLAYRGMAYRLLANDIETLLLEGDKYKKYYFVGLNALSTAEEKIIERLVKAKIAETLWDSDDFYMNTDHRAGAVLKRYKKSGIFGNWNWQSDDLLKKQKNIRVISLETNTLQAKTAGEIYAKALAERKGEQAVIVLGNEQLLEPMMNALDSSIEDFNITMGLSLKHSLLATLVNAIFELQANVVEFKNKTGDRFLIPKFSHRHIHKVLNHPFVRRYELLKYELNEVAENPIRKTLRHITQNNLVYLSEKELQELGEGDSIFAIFFSRWNNNSTTAIECFYQLVDTLRTVYKAAPDAIEIEYLYLFLTILNRIERIVDEYKALEIKNLRHFLNELIREERIPFSGEPVANLQMMSMLETRCLDFDHVIITSLNEGLLPSSSRNNSLIPYDAAIEFGLPVYRNQDAVMAYHFFRLLQRAKNIDLLYLQSSGGGVGGAAEPSRFILQIENELLNKNPNIVYSKPKLVFTESDSEAINSKIEIEKSPEILKKLANYLTVKGLYPSNLNDYLRCSLQFYFKKVAELSKKELVDEKVGADIFGNWIHKTLEEIDKEYTKNDRFISEKDVEKIITEIPKRLEEVYEQNFAGIVIDRGINFILKQVAERVLVNFFREQLRQQKFPMEILSYEARLNAELPLKIKDENLVIKIAGIIDRIEKSGDLISVVDYKTGYVEEKEISTKDLNEEILLPKNEKLRQLWLYKYIVLKNNAENSKLASYMTDSQHVNAKIYSFRNLKERIETTLTFENNETVEDFLTVSENHLKGIIEEMFDTSTPFLQTEEIKNCTFCDFKGICGR